MPSTNGFQFTPDDLEILHWVYSLRLAHIGHLQALTGRSEKALARRLVKLCANRYLATVTQRPRKHLYVVGSEGLPILIEAGFAPDEILGHRPRHFELKEIWLNHFLLVVDTHVRLILVTRGSGVEVVRWQEGPALWDSVTIQVNGVSERAPVRPDAFFALRNILQTTAKATQYFFLEADRSTMSHARIEAKIRAYVNYFQQGLHREKYPGMKLFQVLVLTQTAARAENLATAMRPAIPGGAQRWYHFLPLEKLSLEALLPAFSPVSGTA
jgi:hypothetical protein